MAVIAQLEKLNTRLSGSQPLLFSKTALQKKRKRELKEPQKSSFNEDELTEDQSSADEPKTKKSCYSRDP